MATQITVTKWIWEFTGQAAHLCAAALAMTILSHHVHNGHWWGLAVGIPAAALKEFWYDEKYEDPATRGSSLLDFSMYMVGLLIGWFV